MPLMLRGQIKIDQENHLMYRAKEYGNVSFNLSGLVNQIVCFRCINLSYTLVHPKQNTCTSSVNIYDASYLSKLDSIRPRLDVTHVIKGVYYNL